MLKVITLLVIGAVLAMAIRFFWGLFFSFKAQTPELYRDGGPKFDIAKVLTGTMDAEGLIYDFRGRVTSRFVAKMNANWDGGNGHMSEDFQYETGRSQHREWTITMGQDGHFTATAPDIIGISKGRQMGNSARLEYTIVLPDDVGGYKLDVVDWMYLMENGTVMNRSEFRKFGIKVAELVATFRAAD